MSKCSVSDAAARPGSDAERASEGVLGRTLILLALAALAAQAVLGPRGSVSAHAAVVGLSVLVAVVAPRVSVGPAASASASLCACVVVAVRTGLPWQGAMALALAAFGVLAWRFPRLRPGADWRATGRVLPGLSAVVGGVTPLALSGWLLLMKPDLHDIVDAYVPHLPLPILGTGAVVFALLNATLEEMIWRGVLQDRLEAAFGVAGAILLQGASFGLQHAWGFPRGWIGVLLAGMWALMLGVLRARSRGLLAPVLAHVVADATIAVLVLAVVR